MKLTVSIDANNVLKSSDSSYWCNNTVYSYEFWLRYISVFDDVVGAVRVGRKLDNDSLSINRVDGPHVEICEFPMVKGMKSYLLNYLKIIQKSNESIQNSNAVIVRLPSAIGFQIFEAALKKKIPVALEVVADPYEAYKPNKIARTLYSEWLKRAVKKANGVSYVTKEYLQSKYPCRALTDGESAQYFTTNYSSINLDGEFYGRPKAYTKKNKWCLVHTANGIHNYLKGHDTVIKALKIIRDKGYDVSVTFIGDGRIRNVFENMAKEYGVNRYVTFTGLIADRVKMRDILINSDIFVFPTHTEGLPRSVIEAMAVGLPCISTPVGGVPELLPSEYLLPPTDAYAWAEKIMFLIDNPMVMTEMSKNNYMKASVYKSDVITRKRNEFYDKLKNIAERN